MKKIITILLSVLLLVSLITLPVSAKNVVYAPYEGYEYNDYDESVAAPIGYLCKQIVDSESIGLSLDLKEPSDLVYDGRDSVFILDSGNGRIIELDINFALKNIYETFTDADGKAVDIVGAQGMTLNLDGSCFYIANTQYNEVIKVERESGTVIHTITRPDEVLLNTEADFAATKVVVDKKDQLYILVRSMNVGAFVYNSKGEFLRFFGSNPILTTSEILRDYLWKKFMTKEQRKGMTRITPTAFTNFDVDGYGFLYTVSAGDATTAEAGLVRRLNYSGNNIIEESLIFGDLEWDRAYGNESKSTSFSDVDIDAAGYINLLDIGRGRVFQYNTDGKMVSAFGSFGEQMGAFSSPVAIESIGERIYVLDAVKNSILCFSPTEYAAAIRNAFALLGTTDTVAAKEAWTDVLKMNTNSLYAYYGIGMALDQEGRYAEAMEQFKLAGAHVEYSKALREYRKEFINTNYLWIVLAIVGIAVAVTLIVRVIKKKLQLVHGTAYSALESKYGFPVYTALHPADGFEQFRTRDVMSLRLSAIFVIAWFFIKTAAYFYTGYSFNHNRASDYQFLMTLFMTVGLYGLFIVSNWSVCSLMNGKGTLKQISVTCAYGLVPYLLCEIIKIFMSNILTVEESAFIGIVGIIGLLWSALVLFVGLLTIHQYSFWETVGSILLTVVFMALICFIAVLFYTLLQQLVNFIRSAIAELSLR